jgi:hypothetical protein
MAAAVYSPELPFSKAVRLGGIWRISAADSAVKKTGCAPFGCLAGAQDKLCLRPSRRGAEGLRKSCSSDGPPHLSRPPIGGCPLRPGGPLRASPRARSFHGSRRCSEARRTSDLSIGRSDFGSDWPRVRVREGATGAMEGQDGHREPRLYLRRVAGISKASTEAAADNFTRRVVAANLCRSRGITLCPNRYEPPYIIPIPL